MSTTETDAPEQLRQWARGMYNTEASVELLIRALNGRFAQRGNPWVRESENNLGRLWLDVERISDDGIGAYAGGERRILQLVAALLETRPIDLGDIAAGVDRYHLQLTLAAIVHAGGSHQHSNVEFDLDAGVMRSHGYHPSLYPWPGDTAAE